MTELARSADTGEILNAKVAWERSCRTDDFTGASMFMCLDTDHCGIQLTLTKYGDENAKRKFFTPHKREGHLQECVMQHGTEEEKEELQGKLNPNASPEEIRQMLEFGNKSIVVREHTVRNNVKSDVSIATKGKTEEEQKTAVKHYNKLKNKVLADSEITRIGSLYSNPSKFRVSYA